MRLIALFAFFALVIVFATVVAIGRFLRASLGGAAWLRRALRRRRALDVAEVRAGARGKIVGTVEAVGEPVTAPVTLRPAVHYEALAEQLPGNNRLNLWTTLASERRTVDFRVRDRTGAILVRAAAARIDAPLDRDSEEVFGPGEAAFLARHHVARTPAPLRLREGAIAVGDEVAVLARWRQEADGVACEPGAIVSNDPTTMA